MITLIYNCLKAFVTRQDQKLFVDDNVSEISYELPASTDIPLRFIISDENLRIGKIFPFKTFLLFYLQ